MLVSEAIRDLQNLTNVRVTQADIARVLNVTPVAINKRVIRNSELKLSEVEQLERYYAVSLINSQLPDDVIGIDYYPEVFGSCGNGIFALSEQKEKINVPKKLISNYSKIRQYSVINAIGDSMLPNIHDKDKLIVEHWNGEQIKDNRVYIFRIDENIYIKRLVDNIDQIVIKSDNSMYPIRIVEKSNIDMQIIGCIVGLMRDMG